MGKIEPHVSELRGRRERIITAYCGGVGRRGHGDLLRRRRAGTSACVRLGLRASASRTRKVGSPSRGAAARLGVSERTLRKLMDDGERAYVDVGGGKERRSHAVRAAGHRGISGKAQGDSMAVYKRGEIYHYEFEYRGHRLRGSTGCTSKREAQEFERNKRQEAAEAHKRHQALGRNPMTWAVAASRYWDEVGKHTRSADRTLVALDWLTRHIGEATPLAAVTSDKIARLVAKRRADGIAAATVNRSMTEPLRRVLTRARLVWGVALPPIEWRRHLLAEPQERIRELRADEEATFFAALRPDYHPVARFALLTGSRLSECVGLTWADVDWAGRLIWINGKGGRRASIPMPPSVRELLWPLQGPPSDGGVHLSRDGWRGRHPPQPRTQAHHLQRARATDVPHDPRAGIADFSFHDLRHTAATRVLRATGNLNVVKRMLRHTNIRMTVKYAHSQHDDVLAGMEAAAASAEPRHGVPTQGPHSDTLRKAKADV